MLDHILITVPPSRLQEITTWYLAALAPLGYQKWKDYPDKAVGLGPAKYNTPFWIAAGETNAPNSSNVDKSGSADKSGSGDKSGIHIAFRTDSREKVDEFHKEAVKAGGRCNGKPGVRNMYHDKYYAGFVWDPVG